MGFFNKSNFWNVGNEGSQSESSIIADTKTEPKDEASLWFDRENKTIKIYDEELKVWTPITSEPSLPETSGNQGVTNMPQLIEVNQSLTVGGYGAGKVSIPVGFNKYDIRIVEASNNMNQNISLSIYESAVNGKKIYQSLSQMALYDICNIPCEDKDGEKMIHIEVKNHGMNETEINLTVKATSLQ